MPISATRENKQLAKWSVPYMAHTVSLQISFNVIQNEHFYLCLCISKLISAKFAQKERGCRNLALKSNAFLTKFDEPIIELFSIWKRYLEIQYRTCHRYSEPRKTSKSHAKRHMRSIAFMNVLHELLRQFDKRVVNDMNKWLIVAWRKSGWTSKKAIHANSASIA